MKQTRMTFTGVYLLAVLLCGCCTAEDSPLGLGARGFADDAQELYRSPKAARLAGKASNHANDQSYRLPASVHPYQYHLALQPEIYSLDPSTFTFNGSVDIFIQIHEPTSTIILHSHELDEQTIRDSARLLFSNGTDTGYVKEVTFDTPRDFLIVSLTQELSVGWKFRLCFKFKAPLPSTGLGFHYTSYRDDDETTVYLATTKFEAIYARQAFPCFDEPALKAITTVTLVRRKEYNGRQYRSWSNSDLLYTEDRGGGYVADVYQPTLLTSTYLLAFIVADFKCLSSTTKHNIKYSTCARPNAYMYGKMVHDWGVRELEWLQDTFTLRYNMPKLDSMAIPNFLSGGMENWGLITFHEDILYEEGVTTASDKSWAVEVTAHELAHMWFGDMVTMEWWSWLWMKEAFPSFLDFSLVDILQPDWRKADQHVVNTIHSVMVPDSLPSSHPMTVDVETPADIQAIFDPITYSKGSAIIRMMHFVMGRDDFIAGLNEYLHEYQYGVANHTLMFRALDTYLRKKGRNLRTEEVMEAWVVQANFPVVNVDWTSSGEVTLTQKRFLSTEQGSDSRQGDSTAPFGYTWDIPITVATSVNPDYDVDENDVTWFKKSQPHLTMSNTDIPAPPTQGDLSNWLLLNVQQQGYYRVNYPEANWLALIDQLKRDPTVIHPINRAQIINDAWSLARAGQLRMNIAILTLQVLKNDDDYIPWRAISGELGYLDLMLGSKDTYRLFKKYMVQLVKSAYGHLGMTSKPNEPPIQMLQRKKIVSYACQYGVTKCREDARQRFTAWKSDLQDKIDVDLRGVILCNGVRFGDGQDWEFVFQQYQSSSPGSEQSDLLSSLACSKDPSLLQRLMGMTLDSNIVRAQDARYVLQSVSANPIGRHMAFAFLKEHFDYLSKLMAVDSVGRMVEALTRHFNTQQELDDVKKFIAENDVSLAKTSFAQAVDQTSVNMKWMQDYYPMIEQFLNDSSNW